MARAPANPKAFPTLALETVLIQRVNGHVCGVDEAGRGPWAGPVMAGAVALSPDPALRPKGLRDAPLLSRAPRHSTPVRFTHAPQTSP